MHGDIIWISMHITGENTVNSYALGHHVFLLCILLVKHGK